MRINSRRILIRLVLSGLVGIVGCGKSGPEAVVPESPMVEMNKIKDGSGPSYTSTDVLLDPKEICSRMIKALYSANSVLTSYSCDLEYDVPNSSKIHQQIVTVYRNSPQPAKIRRLLMDQQQGSHDYYADGTNVTSYSRLTNTYIRREVRGDITMLATQLELESPMILSTSSLLKNNKEIDFLSGIKLLGKEVLNGKECYIVEGTFTPKFLEDLARISKFKPGITPIAGTAKLWIDVKSYFVQKSIGTISVELINPQTKQRAVVHQMLTQKLERVVLNAILEDKFFSFTAPSKAQENFPPRESPTIPVSKDPFAIK